MSLEYDPQEHGPSPEMIADGIRRAGRKLDDLELDEQIALARARRDVRAAHGKHHAAEVWQNVMVAFHDVRADRQQTRREFEDLVNPFQSVEPQEPC